MGRWAAGLLSQPTLHHRRHQQRHQRRHHHSQHPHRDDHRHHWQRGRWITSVCNIISGMCVHARSSAPRHNEQLGARTDSAPTLTGKRTIRRGSTTLLQWKATRHRRATVKRDSGPSVCETRSETARCFYSRPLAGVVEQQLLHSYLGCLISVAPFKCTASLAANWGGAGTGLRAHHADVLSTTRLFTLSSARLRRYGSLDALGPFPMRLSITLVPTRTNSARIYFRHLRVSRASFAVMLCGWKGNEILSKGDVESSRESVLRIWKLVFLSYYSITFDETEMVRIPVWCYQNNVRSVDISV